jgi:hypothetical protein
MRLFTGLIQRQCAPFVAKGTRSDGRSWRSKSLAPMQTIGFTTLNLNGLTNKVASNVVAAMNRAGDAFNVTPNRLATNPNLSQVSKDKLNSGLSSRLTYWALSPASFNPVGELYQLAAPQPYNKLLARVDATKNIVACNTVVVANNAGGTQRYVDGQLMVAGFKSSGGVAADSVGTMFVVDTGNVFVADAGNHGVCKITPASVDTTLMGDGPVGQIFYRPGRLTSPTGLVVGANGNVLARHPPSRPSLQRVMRALGNTFTPNAAAPAMPLKPVPDQALAC